MIYYNMFAHSSIAEYAMPDDDLRRLCDACALGDLQFLDRTPLEVGLEPEGGLMFPDFIVYLDRVPLVSLKLRQALDEFGVDNLFYKPVSLVERDLGLREQYWLALPPRIDCLDWDECDVEETSPASFPGWIKTWEAKKIVIDPEKTGRYFIFKPPPNTANQEIIVRRELKEFLEPFGFENLNFYQL